MIYPKTVQTPASVAAHYDDLDIFYREIWGEHIHHGYWKMGNETPEQATQALIGLVAQNLALDSGQTVIDIGCGYGGTAQYLGETYNLSITGLTLSAAQLAHATARTPTAGHLNFIQSDWQTNSLPDQAFDRAYAIESSEHMPDKLAFFTQAYRTLKPNARLVICAWLAAQSPTPWHVKHLLEPICREGRLPSMGTEIDYSRLAQSAGFKPLLSQDISAQVSKTWRICARRLAAKLFQDSRYIKTLLNPAQPNRIFALTLFRLIAAYQTRAMRYVLLVYQKPSHPL